MNTTSKTLTSLALLATTAIAQANIAVYPSDHTAAAGAGRPSVPGSSAQSSFPFSSGVSRQMALYTAIDMRVPNGREITHVGFPTDDRSTSTGVRIQLEIRMGQSNNDVNTVSSTFDSNYAGTPTVVFARRIFDLPTLSTPNAIVWVPLDVPFRIDSSRSLVVEYIVTANANGNASFSYWLDAGSYISSVSSFGTGCATSGGQIPQLTSSQTAIGDRWSINLSRGAASSPVTLLVGISRPANGIRLDAFGAPGCQLLVDTLATAGGMTGSSGSFSWSFPTPFDPTLVDGHLYSQAAISDLFANNLGVVTSNGDDLEFGLRPQVATVTATGNASAPTGGVTRNSSIISLFGYR